MITIYPEKFSLLLMSMVPVRTLFPPFKVLDNHTIKSIARSSLCPCNVDHHFVGMTRKTRNVFYGIKNWQASFILDCISYHSLIIRVSFVFFLGSLDLTIHLQLVLSGTNGSFNNSTSCHCTICGLLNSLDIGIF